MIAALLAVAAPPPVAMVDEGSAETPAPETRWTCNLTLADRTPMTVSGTFPAVSAEALRNGGQYRLRAVISEPASGEMAGPHPAAMTSHIVGMANYSIAVGGQEQQIADFVLTFQFFDGSRRGFVNVAQFARSSSSAAPASALPTAYAAGLCQTQVGPTQ
jgi:hypothetical protein